MQSFKGSAFSVGQNTQEIQVWEVATQNGLLVKARFPASAKSAKRKKKQTK